LFAQLSLGPEQIAFILPLLESFGDKARYVRGMLFAPTEAEYRTLQLPPVFQWLYYPYRLARLALKHGKS
jgi:hypothetical protein